MEMSIEGHNAMVSRGWARVLWPSVAVASGLWGAAMAGDLPPPPGSMEAVADAQLFLELVVNQMDTGRVVAAHAVKRQDHLARLHRGTRFAFSQPDRRRCR